MAHPYPDTYRCPRTLREAFPGEPEEVFTASSEWTAVEIVPAVALVVAFVAAIVLTCWSW